MLRIMIIQNFSPKFNKLKSRLVPLVGNFDTQLLHLCLCSPSGLNGTTALTFKMQFLKLKMFIFVIVSLILFNAWEFVLSTKAIMTIIYRDLDEENGK